MVFRHTFLCTHLNLGGVLGGALAGGEVVHSSYTTREDGAARQYGAPRMSVNARV